MRTVVQFLHAGDVSEAEIYRRMTIVYGALSGVIRKCVNGVGTLKQMFMMQVVGKEASVNR